MAKFNLEKIYEQLDKCEDENELEEAINSIIDFAVKKLKAKKDELDAKSEVLAEKIKSINGN